MIPAAPHPPKMVPQTGQSRPLTREIPGSALLLGLVMALLHHELPAQQTKPTTKPATATSTITPTPRSTTRPQPATIATKPATSAATRPTIRPTTRPATTAQAVPAPPPKTIALAFAAAIEKGDAPAAKALITTGDSNARWVDSTIELANSLKKLDVAAIARFGEPGRTVSQNTLGMLEALKSLPQAQETIQQDRATVGALRLRRVGNKWLIEPPSPQRQHLARHQKLYALLAAAADQTAAEIAAGRYATPQLAAAAFARRALDARLNAA